MQTHFLSIIEHSKHGAMKQLKIFEKSDFQFSAYFSRSDLVQAEVTEASLITSYVRFAVANIDVIDFV